MIVLYIIAVLITFLIVRVSILCMLWSLKKPNDIKDGFRIYFPYYMIGLTAICVTFILEFNFSYMALYYFGSVYVMALLIWRRELTKANRQQLPIKKEETLLNTQSL